MRRELYLLLLVLICVAHVSGQTTLTTSNDTTICLGGTATLSATVNSGSYGTTSYTFQTIPFSSEPMTGGTSVCPSFVNCSSTNGGKDDCTAGPFDIGFNFCFFSQNYSQFWIGSNGWISFSEPPPGNAWTTYIATTIPNAAPSVPKNVIFFPWEDWLPCYQGAIDVFFYTTGSAPDRKLVVYWSMTTFFNGSCHNLHATFQAVLHEQSSIIENNIINKPLCSNENATQGVQNIDGTIAFTATGRNYTQWSTMSESTRFVPSGITWYTGGYPGGTIVGFGTPITFSPTVTTTYTAVVQECDGTTATGNVTVTVINAAFDYLVYNYCQSDPDPIPIVVNPGGTFTASPPGLVFVNANTGIIDLPASAPGTYTITYTITVPCTVSTSHNLTINATPAVPVPLATYVSRCGPGSVTFGVIQPPGVTIKWYDAPTGGNLLFTGSSVTTNVNVTTHFYAEALTTATICTSFTRADILVNIKPIPVISNTTLSFSICSGDSIKIPLLSSLLNSTFAWRAYDSSPNLSGYSNGSGSRIAQKLFNSGSVFDSVTYAVAATKDTCTGDTVRFAVTVKPVFDASANPVTQQICSNSSFDINLTSSHPTTIFTWTATGSSPNVMGYSNGTGPMISQTLINTGPAIETVTYKIVPVGFGCIGDTVISTVTVRPYPDLSNNPKNKSICNNTATGITLTSNIPGTLFTWTTTPSSPSVSGYSNQVVPSSTLNQTLTNTAFTTQNVIYHITPHNNGCNGVVTDFTVNVFPVSDVLFVPPSQSMCSGQQTSINLNSDVTGTTFTWTAHASSPSITGFSAGSGILIQQLLQNSSQIPGTATYIVSSSANGCPGRTDSVRVTVKPVPQVSLVYCIDSVTTTNAQPYTLRGGTPLGGTWSGPGVSLGIFSPAIAGAGTKTIVYSYTNSSLCTANASLQIVVQNPSFGICGSNLTDLRDNQTYPTVVIGTQCWMAANLNFGSRISYVQTQRDNCTAERYCYNDIFANCGTFGGLYQWDELMEYQDIEGTQGLCPPGWHIPSESEWNILFDNFISNGFAANPLKNTGFSGFDAFLYGVNFMDKKWGFNNFATLMWSSTSHSSKKAWAHGMNSFDPSVSFYPALRSNAFSIRCLKD
jgi:uncharacterized protein (TIGR02145 family)